MLKNDFKQDARTIRPSFYTQLRRTRINQLAPAFNLAMHETRFCAI